MFAVQMELTPKARHTKLRYILQDVTIQRIPRFRFTRTNVLNCSLAQADSFQL